MPHEVATGLDDFECAGFRVAGPGSLASAENRGSICQRGGRERRSSANRIQVTARAVGHGVV